MVTSIEDLTPMYLTDALGAVVVDTTVEPVGVGVGLIGQLVRFAVIGAVSTLAYIALFVLLRGPMPAQAANLTALFLTAVANTAANRRLTFGLRGRGGAARAQFQGLVVFALGLALTSGTLALLHAVDPNASQAAELTLLVVANAVATLLRFVLFRAWVFRRRTTTPRAETTPAVLEMEIAR